MANASRFVLIACLCFAGGCDRLFDFAGGGVVGSGVIKTDKRDVGPVASVEVSGSYTVEIVCQQDPAFEIEGDDNLLPLVHTDVTDGKLSISNEGHFSSKTGLKIRISTPKLRGMSASGANTVSIRDVDIDHLSVIVNGASELTATGKATSVTIESNGASKVNARDLHAARVRVNLTGAGDASVSATDEVIADVSGAGSVTYFGDPKTVTKHTSGAASVNKG